MRVPALPSAEGPVEIVSFAEVERAWSAADTGKGPASTLGLLHRFQKLVKEWRRRPLTPALLETLHLIGGREEWSALSRGKFLVRECARVPAVTGEAPGTHNSVPVDLIAVGSGDRLVLLDGNKRAVALWHEHLAGRAWTCEPRLYSGELETGFLHAASAVAPLIAPVTSHRKGTVG